MATMRAAVELPHVGSSARSSSSRGSVNSAGSSASDRSDRNQRKHAPVAPPPRISVSFGVRDAAAAAATGYGDNHSRAHSDEEEDIDGEYDNAGGEEDDGDYEDDDGNDVSSSGANGNGSDDPHEASGGELWDEVESFLNRPSPSLAAIAKSEKKATRAANVLPTLATTQSQQQRASRPPVRSVYQQQSTAASKAAAPKTIDPKLLQEAFAYAQKMSQLDFDDGDQQQADVINDRHHPLARSNSRSQSSSSVTSLNASSGARDAPRAGRKASAPGAKCDDEYKSQKKKSAPSKTSVYGSGNNNSSSAGAKPVKRKSERRIKEAMQWDPSSANSASDPSAEGSSNNNASRKHMDPQTMQSLVSNFQNGTTLDELRKELAASQQSMAQSRQVLHEAAKTFFQPSR